MKSSAKVPRWIMVISAIFCVIGILLSGYSYHVEIAHESDPTFRALCDISEGISCTKVFSSRWGRGFGLFPKDSIFNQPNSVFGMAYYLTQALLVFSTANIGAVIQLGLSVTSGVGSVYLGYILFFVLHDFCVICVTMYVINAVMLACCVLKYLALRTKQDKKQDGHMKKKRN